MFRALHALRCSHPVLVRVYSTANIVSRSAPRAAYNVRSHSGDHTYGQKVKGVVELLQSGRFQECISRCKELEAQGHRLDRFVRPYFTSLSRSGGIDTVLSEVQRIKQSLSSPHVHVWNSAIIECTRHGRLSDAEELLMDMHRSIGIPPRCNIINNVVNGYVMNRDIVSAERVVAAMRSVGVQPDASIYTSLLYGFIHCANGEKVQHLLAEMRAAGIEPTALAAHRKQMRQTQQQHMTPQQAPDAKNSPYLVLAYYMITHIADPDADVQRHLQFLKNRDVAGRIFICDQGISGQMSGARPDALAYMDWMHEDARFKDMEFKVHFHHENAFARLSVKHKALVALDERIPLDVRGDHVSPAQWRKMLEDHQNGKEKDLILLDVRNKYEWDIGRFSGAIRPDCDTFREWSEFARTVLKQRANPNTTKVMMYCTGGIRCELYSAALKREGFEHVFQLDGGVIKYGLTEGAHLWEGKLFVFDDRLVIPISPDATSVVSRCSHCGAPADAYFNCANMSCNDLFVACPSCIQKHAGCCQESCQHGPAVRAREPQDLHKPFRRWYSLLKGMTI